MKKPSTLGRVWKASDKNGNGTIIDFSCNAGKNHHRAILAGKVTLPRLAIGFSEDKESLSQADGQVVLNGVIYATLLDSIGANHGPPCFFHYPTKDDRQEVMDGLINNLWRNGFGCTKKEEGNELYSVLKSAPHLPIGRLPFVIVMDAKGYSIKGNDNDEKLMKRMEKFRTLSKTQKSAIRILLSQKYELMD